MWAGNTPAFGRHVMERQLTARVVSFCLMRDSRLCPRLCGGVAWALPLSWIGGKMSPCPRPLSCLWVSCHLSTTRTWYNIEYCLASGALRESTRKCTCLFLSLLFGASPDVRRAYLSPLLGPRQVKPCSSRCGGLGTQQCSGGERGTGGVEKVEGGVGFLFFYFSHG